MSFQGGEMRRQMLWPCSQPQKQVISGDGFMKVTVYYSRTFPNINTFSFLKMCQLIFILYHVNRYILTLCKFHNLPSTALMVIWLQWRKNKTWDTFFFFKLICLFDQLTLHLSLGHESQTHHVLWGETRQDNESLDRTSEWKKQLRIGVDHPGPDDSQLIC